MDNIIQFRHKKPTNIKQYIDFEKGWKFTENDKDFLISFYESYIEALIELCDGDFVEDYQEILEYLKIKGVQLSKDLIQEDAIAHVQAVDYDIYEYYKDNKDVLIFLENSIIDVQW